MNLGETSRLPRGEHDQGRAGRVARFGLVILLAANPALASSQANRSAALGACAIGNGTVRAHLVIAPMGNARVERATGELASCASDVLRATVFPASTVVTAIDVTLTW